MFGVNRKNVYIFFLISESLKMHQFSFFLKIFIILNASFQCDTQLSQSQFNVIICHAHFKCLPWLIISGCLNLIYQCMDCKSDYITAGCECIFQFYIPIPVGTMIFSLFPIGGNDYYNLSLDSQTVSSVFLGTIDAFSFCLFPGNYFDFFFPHLCSFLCGNQQESFTINLCDSPQNLAG